MSDENPSFTQVVFSIVVLVVVGALFVSKNCTDSEHPRLLRCLELQGYKNAELGGFSWGCGDDLVCWSFTAKSPSGHPVRGSVGSGAVVKGCTVRLDP